MVRSKRNLAYMIRFAEIFPDEQILHTLCAKLSWSHFRQVIPMDDTLKRDFYTEMCRIESWSTRTLQKKIDSMLYERTALSKKPEETARHELDQLRESDRVTPQRSAAFNKATPMLHTKRSLYHGSVRHPCESQG